MYELGRHRFKELKHFCLQYPEWKMRYDELYGSGVVDEEAVAKADYIRAMKLIETTANSTDVELGSYILEFVTTDISFRTLDPPVNKLVFDFLCRKFYWLLSNSKGV